MLPVCQNVEIHNSQQLLKTSRNTKRYCSITEQ